ncbi:hypothetical protein H0H92_007001 [Tricholoma furcatifolium]|nr:hypothetical protein H0H92_007001 [Tricholoma furcatifolium]
MSRHRHYRNINIEDELDDDALSDGGEEMTDEQHAQLLHGLEEVRNVLGDESVSGLSDKDLKDALWEFFFDQEQTIQWALEEQSRRQLARERKGPDTGKDLPPLPAEAEEGASNTEYYHPEQYNFPTPEQPVERSRGPLVFQYQGPLEVSELETPRVLRPVLSTITERTERTELTPHLPPSHRLPSQRSPRSPSTFSTSSYGELIEPAYNSRDPMDPNSIPVSPSLSALNALSLYEPAPSASASEASSIRTAKNLRSAVASPSEGLPEIPDFNSKSSNQPALVTPPPKQSKLSLLASSRASSISSRSESSRSSGTTVTGSVKTFPILRPSAQSVRPPSSKAPSIPPSPRPASTLISNVPGANEVPSPRPASTSTSTSNARGANESSFNPQRSATSSMTSLVRRAINTAMELEALDKAAPPKSTPETPPLAFAPSNPSPEKDVGPTEPECALPSTSRSMAASAPPESPRIYKEVDMFRTAPSESSRSPQPLKEAARPPSKLALLAQKSASRPKVPKPSTEYLTPIGNGPTATTAITTSYQTLYTLTDPKRSRVIPPQFVVPFGATPPVPPPIIKGSKLAQKIRKAHEKQPEANEEENHATTPVSPMFQPESAGLARASPSAFASLLIDDAPAEDKRRHRSSRHREKEYSQTSTSSISVTAETDHSERRRHPSRRRKERGPPVPDFSTPLGFKFDGPSPDDIVLNARRAAKEREKAIKKAAGTSSASSSCPSSALNTPTKKKPGPAGKKSGSSTPARGMDARQLDLSALNLSKDEDEVGPEETPVMSYAKEKLLEEAKRAIEADSQNGKKGVSLVVIGRFQLILYQSVAYWCLGHVDAGKSTLMGRLLYELGRLEEKTRIANERGSAKAGKSSFSWAWGLDGTTEERERGITMDIALQSLTTPHRQVTVLDAPGHKDFIPNMISGASQADCALLVVDSANGEFEAGFERGGQTREHLLLVRSLGVAQVIVAINKLDQVNWDKDRFEEICTAMQPFLVQSGFHPSKTKFVPVGAMEGVNLVNRDGNAAEILRTWQVGEIASKWIFLRMMTLLDVLEPPTREIMAPLRIPISNVFKSHGSGAAVSGRLCGGVVQVGERLRILPGDETGVVKCKFHVPCYEIAIPNVGVTAIEVDEQNVPWAAAGSNATLYLTSVDPVNLSIGSVLCSTADIVPLATSFSARIIVFDIQVPITAGTSVELFHHSRDVPATVSKLLSTIDRASGKILKANPRVLTKGASAEVTINLRSTTMSGPAIMRPIPLETFAANKDMGRILIRRGGETIGAGIVLAIES